MPELKNLESMTSLTFNCYLSESLSFLSQLSFPIPWVNDQLGIALSPMAPPDSPLSAALHEEETEETVTRAVPWGLRCRPKFGRPSEAFRSADRGGFDEL
jgi:hypothetical protein